METRASVCGNTCLGVWKHVPRCVETRASVCQNTCLLQTAFSTAFCFFLDGGGGVFFTVTKSSSIDQPDKNPTD